MSERAFAVVRALTPAVVTAGILAVLPLFATTGYDTGVFTTFCINLIILVGLNLLSGYGGQLSMGQAAFYGIGAYTITIGSVKHGLDPVLAFFLAPVVAAAFAILVGLPSLRLRGLYFAMATLGVGVIFEQFLDRATNVTSGPNGLGLAPVKVLGIDFSNPRAVYAAAAVIAWIGVVAAQLFLRTHAGWGLRAAAASEPAAAVVGVNTYGVRLVVLGISGAYAGIAGGLEAFNSLYVSPSTFNFFFSVLLFIVLTIGGMASWSGPLFGAALLLVFDRWLSAYSQQEPIILAAIFVICLRVFPRGIGQTVEAFVGETFRRLVRSRPAATPPEGEAEAA